CVIATCMDISTINSALIRGGRIELSIPFNNPESAVITKILKTHMNRVVTNLSDTYPKVSNKIKDLNKDTLTMISNLMRGWNCFNIIRVIESVIRSLLWDDSKFSVYDLFKIEIDNIDHHGKMCIQNIACRPPNDSYYT